MHWTYAAHELTQDLEQGDILKPSDALSQLLQTVHPHFCADKYSGFMVLTQSCDLVRRNGVAKAQYLQICVIRPLRQALPKIFADSAKRACENVYSIDDKYTVKGNLAKIFNQNEQAQGLFFLYNDYEGAGLAEDSLAFLRVTVSLKAEHYGTLMNSRTGKLQPEFRAKLGWLIGNLFDRPATPDWTDYANGKLSLDRLIADCVKSARWLPAAIIKAAE